MLGATLEGIDVQSTDEDWNATFVKKIKSLTYKLVELSSFALYMNLDEDPNKDFISRMQGLPLSQVHDLLQESVSCVLLFSFFFRHHHHHHHSFPFIQHKSNPFDMDLISRI